MYSDFHIISYYTTNMGVGRTCTECIPVTLYKEIICMKTGLRYNYIYIYISLKQIMRDTNKEYFNFSSCYRFLRSLLLYNVVK